MEAKIYDFGAEHLDRYTIVINGVDMYGASENPFHPMGFGQYLGNVPNDLSCLGKEIEYENLNADVQRYVNYLIS